MLPEAGTRCLRRLAILGALCAPVEPAPALEPPPAPAVAAPVAAAPDGAMVALRRLVHHFDFEEGAVTPLPMPLNFHRHLRANEDFPPFGDMRLADDHAASGDWSFRFELDGGSIAARVPTAVLNVMPLGDYLVSTRVRTEGLTHARARVIAWLHDARGEVIPGSIVRSRPVHTAGRWSTLTVAIEGRFESAADLVVELQLAQPRQFLGDALPTDEPVLEDARGRAWFDDVMIWHLPRIEMTTNAPLNLIGADQTPTLQVSVRDLTGEALTADLAVRDLDGREVYRKSFDAPRGRHPRSLPLPALAPGWYEADLTVRNRDGLGGRQSITFWVLPEIDRRAAPITRRFAVAVPALTAARLQELPDLVRALRVGGALLPVWDDDARSARADDLDGALRRCLERLLNSRVELSCALNAVPLDIAGRAGLDPHQVLELLGAGESHWRASLDELVTRFGLDVGRWQIGRTGRDDLFWQDDLQPRVAAASASLRGAVPSARLLLPVRAEQAIPLFPGPHAYHVLVPHQVSPPAILDLARTWAAARDGLIVTFELLPPEDYAPRAQAADLMLRALHGWRADLPQMAIRAPWHESDGPDPQIVPDLAFGVWRLLASKLDGRTFGGQFELGPDITCWILEGAGPEDAALVAWTDRVPTGEPARLDMMLADGPVRVTDCTGAARLVHLRGGRHSIELGPAPMFIENVSLELARFRESFAITPDSIESVHRLHEHELLLHNPWDISVSGVVNLLETDDWRITPRVHRFDIAPRGRVSLPVNIVFDRATVSGRKTIAARIELIADHDYVFEARTHVDLGLRDIDFAATWRVARNVQTGRLDLIVTQTVANQGDRTMSLDLFLIGPGISRQRRPVATLPPGGSVVRTFRVPDGATLLAGRTLRVGVSDRVRGGRHNEDLAIPATLSADDAVARGASN